MDNFMISASAESDSHLSTRLQVKLDNMYDWPFVREIKFNGKKFKVLPSTDDNKIFLRISGEEVKVSDHTPNLGVIFSYAHAMDYACWKLERLTHSFNFD